MKVLSALLLSALLGAASASAADLERESPREKALMLYFSKSLGGNRAHMPLAFGLRLQQSSPFDAGRAMAFVDARYWVGGPKVLAFAGVPTLSLGSSESEGSSGGSSGASSAFRRNNPGWTAVMIAAALLGGACLFEVGICEDDPDRDPAYERPSPTGPG